MIIPDPYYLRPEVSNSDLSRLKNELYPRDVVYDVENAYRFGNLLDCMITEPARVNFFKCEVAGEKFPREDFERAERMKSSFYRDPFCRDILKGASTQKTMVRRQKFSYGGFRFELDTRCKWDLLRPDLGYGGDIKSTTAKTQTEFEAAAKYFDYDRQRAWYMAISGSNRDVIIGISKVNFRVFKIFIKKGDSFYNSGVEKYNELAFRWFLIYK